MLLTKFVSSSKIVFSIENDRKQNKNRVIHLIVEIICHIKKLIEYEFDDSQALTNTIMEFISNLYCLTEALQRSIVETKTKTQNESCNTALRADTSTSSSENVLSHSLLLSEYGDSKLREDLFDLCLKIKVCLDSVKVVCEPEKKLVGENMTGQSTNIVTKTETEGEGEAKAEEKFSLSTGASCRIE